MGQTPTASTDRSSAVRRRYHGRAPTPARARQPAKSESVTNGAEAASHPSGRLTAPGPPSESCTSDLLERTFLAASAKGDCGTKYPFQNDTPDSPLALFGSLTPVWARAITRLRRRSQPDRDAACPARSARLRGNQRNAQVRDASLRAARHHSLFRGSAGAFGNRIGISRFGPTRRDHRRSA